MTYSKKPFEGYTHRYKVAFEVYDQDHTSNIDLYTDESDRDRVHEYLVEKVNRRNVSDIWISYKTKMIHFKL